MGGRRTQYSTSIDVYSFAVLASELLAWSLSYSAGGIPTAPTDSADWSECSRTYGQATLATV
jgi:hypothetical protein